MTDTRDLAGLSSEQLLRFYRTMVTSRRIDDREMSLKRQNKIFFQISSAGHEAIGVAVAEHCLPAHDWFFLYYRDRALDALALGQTPLDHFLQAVGAEADPASGGRQMPAHFGDVRYNIANTSSPTGTQFLQAVGAAEAGLRGAAESGASRSHRALRRRRSRGRDHRRRHDVRRRILGVAEFGVQPEAPRGLRGRGQRLRHLRPRRGPDGGRKRVEARERASPGCTSWSATAPTSWTCTVPPARRCATPGSGRGRPCSTPTACGRTPTPCPTMSGCTGPTRSWRPRTPAAPSGGRVPSLSRRAIATAEELDAMEAEVEGEVSAAADEALDYAPAPRGDGSSPSVLRGGRPDVGRLRHGGVARSTRTIAPSRWSTCSTRACGARWSGTPASWCSARTSPTRRARAPWTT